MDYPSLKHNQEVFVPLKDDPDYKPKQPDYEKIKNYKTVK